MNNTVQLQKKFDTKDFQHGASTLKQLLWYFTSCLFFRSGLVPFSIVLVWFLKLFGAKIGKDVRVKPYVHIKFPWKLELGDHSWLAECYIENLAAVIIGKNCCVSQNATLMTGNHNYKSPYFNLITKPIILEDGVWIGASAIVCPGIIAKSHSVLSVGSIATKDLEAFSIYQGNPAVKIRERELS
ncbi:WcaF family extracellular polysaccharide biosynthesis acetyltransferase [Pedobacter psychrophilus]|uniref:WcaF family extracellular polysaccharide biosynthesis acetyltransferase n=1 Tax=Pedobacter psychrophilus TaxID=1826909 RepID=UPI0009ED3EDE|nr:WcaF family extracellular polysaccharide biosynthesis acetyltransferase [Pedobacter psychrophilus]